MSDGRLDGMASRVRGGLAAVGRGRMLAAIVIVAIALSGWLPPGISGEMRYERAAVAAGEWWRLLTAHLVHLGPGHALLNAAALLLILWMAPALRRPLTWFWLALASVAAIDAGLFWFFPRVAWYVGASGALHGMFAGAALLMATRGERVQGSVMLAALAAKLGWESLSGGSLSHAALAGLAVVTESHLLGALGGLAGAALLIGRGRALARLRSAKNV
jgi:rhomboid family GlyGly-CTERM serine protease